MLLLEQDCPTSPALRAAGCGNINLLATATRKQRSSASYASLLLDEIDELQCVRKIVREHSTVNRTCGEVGEGPSQVI